MAVCLCICISVYLYIVSIYRYIYIKAKNLLKSLVIWQETPIPRSRTSSPLIPHTEQVQINANFSLLLYTHTHTHRNTKQTRFWPYTGRTSESCRRTSGMLVLVGLFCLIIGLFCLIIGLFWHLRIPQSPADGPQVCQYICRSLLCVS
jgi:beta-lactamase regulating signal transducer with metallopeptidase domain